MSPIVKSSSADAMAGASNLRLPLQVRGAECPGLRFPSRSAGWSSFLHMGAVRPKSALRTPVRRTGLVRDRLRKGKVRLMDAESGIPKVVATVARWGRESQGVRHFRLSICGLRFAIGGCRLAAPLSGGVAFAGGLRVSPRRRRGRREEKTERRLGCWAAATREAKVRGCGCPRWRAERRPPATFGRRRQLARGGL